MSKRQEGSTFGTGDWLFSHFCRARAHLLAWLAAKQRTPKTITRHSSQLEQIVRCIDRTCPCRHQSSISVLGHSSEWSLLVDDQNRSIVKLVQVKVGTCFAASLLHSHGCLAKHLCKAPQMVHEMLRRCGMSYSAVCWLIYGLKWLVPGSSTGGPNDHEGWQNSHKA